MVCSGDFCQHQPPTGHALFYGADSEETAWSKWKAPARLGRFAWLKFNTCVILHQQHRFTTSTEDGRSLYDLVQLLSRGTQPSLKECAALCDALQTRAIDASQFQCMASTEVPRVVVLRNIVRPLLNAHLTRLQADLAGKRLVVWRCFDAGQQSQPLSGAIKGVLEMLPSNKTGDMPTIQMFYSGIRYKFSQNLFPNVGHVNNNIAIGHALHVDPREADYPDDLSKPYRVLRYPPLAVVVKPEGFGAASLRLSSWPRGCIPVEPQKVRINLSLPEPTQLYEGDAELGTSVKVVRRGFPLESASAVTDYFAQGVSFRGEPHLLHLNVPPDGKMTRANLLVPVSRPSLYSQLHLLTPMWPHGDLAARAKVIRKVHEALKPNAHLQMETARLQALAEETKSRFL